MRSRELSRDRRGPEIVVVDMPMVRDQVARHDAESIEVARGLTINNPNRPGTAKPVEQAGGRVSVTPHSWTRGDCDNSGGPITTHDDNHYYMGDDDRVP